MPSRPIVFVPVAQICRASGPAPACPLLARPALPLEHPADPVADFRLMRERPLQIFWSANRRGNEPRINASVTCFELSTTPFSGPEHGSVAPARDMGRDEHGNTRLADPRVRFSAHPCASTMPHPCGPWVWLANAAAGPPMLAPRC